MGHRRWVALQLQLLPGSAVLLTTMVLCFEITLDMFVIVL